MKAVENGGTAIGIKCKDGVVLAVEKIISSKLLKPGANKRIATVDRNVGVVCVSGQLLREAFTSAFVIGILIGIAFRSRPASFLTADTSLTEPAMKPHHGDEHTKVQSRLPCSPAEWARTSRLTRCIRPCDRLASHPSLRAGILRRS